MCLGAVEVTGQRRVQGLPQPLHIEFQSISNYLQLPQEPGDYAYSVYDPIMDVSGVASFRAEIALTDWKINGIIMSQWVNFTNWYLGMRVGGFSPVDSGRTICTGSEGVGTR